MAINAFCTTRIIPIGHERFDFGSAGQVLTLTWLWPQAAGVGQERGCGQQVPGAFPGHPGPAWEGCPEAPGSHLQEQSSAPGPHS